MLLTDELVPAGLRPARIVLAFLILRPFDIVPTLWYRLLGWVVVRLRLQIRGQGSLGAAAKKA